MGDSDELPRADGAEVEEGDLSETESAHEMEGQPAVGLVKNLKRHRLFAFKPSRRARRGH